MGLNQHETGRRLQAARVIAGYESREQFAEALSIAKFGGGTIKAVERGARLFHDHEIAAVAEFCGLPRAFFTAERARLGPVPGDGADQKVMAEIAELREKLSELLDRMSEPRE